jgi:hypothetical protein
MEYTITDTEAKNIDVELIFKLDALDNHMQEGISIITPLIDVLSDFKYIYEPKAILDYYSRLKRNYEARKSEWLNREKLWQTN